MIYPEYEAMFPEDERKPYEMLESSYNDNITDIIEITVDNQFVGFVLINSVEGNKYAVLDYFAILPRYQNKGYGSKAIKLLKELYKEYEGIFCEVDKAGCGDTDEENMIRERRVKFYENLRFIKLGFDLNLFTVLFSTYILPCSKNEFSDKKVIKSVWKIYVAISGEERVKQNCKVIIDKEEK